MQVLSREDAVQCCDCIHARRPVHSVYSQLFGPLRDKAYACFRAGENMPEVAELVTPLFEILATEGRCPHFDPGEQYPDSYRAEDL